MPGSTGSEVGISRVRGRGEGIFLGRGTRAAIEYIALTKVAMGFADSHAALTYAVGVFGERCIGCSLRKL